VNDCALILAAALAIRWIAARPVVAAAGEQAHRLAVPTDDQPITIVLDLMDPAVPGRRLGSEDRNAGIDKAIGANNEHGRQIAAGRRKAKVYEMWLIGNQIFAEPR
jgi:hypothetical protein